MNAKMTWNKETLNNIAWFNKKQITLSGKNTGEIPAKKQVIYSRTMSASWNIISGSVGS